MSEGNLDHMDNHSARLARLEERVFKSHSEKFVDLKSEVKTITNRLNWLILVLAANFGVTFLKVIHP